MGNGREGGGGLSSQGRKASVVSIQAPCVVSAEAHQRSFQLSHLARARARRGGCQHQPVCWGVDETATA